MNSVGTSYWTPQSTNSMIQIMKDDGKDIATIRRMLAGEAAAMAKVCPNVY